MSTAHAIDLIDSHVQALRVIFGGLLSLTAIFLLSLLISSVRIDAKPTTVSSDVNSSQSASISSDNPNAIANGLDDAGHELMRGLDETGVSLANGSRSAAIGIIKGATIIVSTGQVIGSNTVSGMAFVGRSIVAIAVGTGHRIKYSAVFIAQVPGAIFGSVAKVAKVARVGSLGAVIEPASQVSVPVIDSPAVIVMAARAALPVPPTVRPTATQPTSPTPAVPQPDTIPVWPIHGAITTLFGVPHWPYQPVHTGIDISDGKRPGITPVKPFKPGRVTDVVASNTGLGNHVVVDHGNGLTSVYGHLASINVAPGQAVDKNTIIGIEGSTGASTGTHLHFEIRVNGQADDPLKFISGKP